MAQAEKFVKDLKIEVKESIIELKKRINNSDDNEKSRFYQGQLDIFLNLQKELKKYKL